MNLTLRLLVRMATDEDLTDVLKVAHDGSLLMLEAPHFANNVDAAVNAVEDYTIIREEAIRRGLPLP